MVDPINLNKARKARTASEAKRLAADNRVRFGRTGPEKRASKLEADRAKRAHEAAKRED